MQVAIDAVQIKALRIPDAPNPSEVASVFLVLRIPDRIQKLGVGVRSADVLGRTSVFAGQAKRRRLQDDSMKSAILQFSVLTLLLLSSGCVSTAKAG
jgi:hypothetical protein